MGKDAQYQAIPEDCELLLRARQDRRWAEELQFFPYHMRISVERRRWTKTSPEVANAAAALVQEKPDILERNYVGSSRAYDAIRYLLSSFRRERGLWEWEADQSLIRKAIYGAERLHPEAMATQGMPIGFVPAREVVVIAEYLARITAADLREHYDPPLMLERQVYRVHDLTYSEEVFQFIWKEFAGMQNIYQQAAAHGEAMITVID
jgi:hypothetical protein